MRVRAEHASIYAEFAAIKAVVDEASARTARIALLRARRSKRYSILGERPSKEELSAIDAELRELTHAQDDVLEDIESASRALPAVEERLHKSSDALHAESVAEARAHYAVVHQLTDALMNQAADELEKAYARYCQASLASYKCTQISHEIGGANAMGWSTCASGCPAGVLFPSADRIGPLATHCASPRFPTGRIDLEPRPDLIDAAQKSVDEILVALERATMFGGARSRCDH